MKPRRFKLALSSEERFLQQAVGLNEPLKPCRLAASASSF
jgi:hypothetical protein